MNKARLATVLRVSALLLVVALGWCWSRDRLTAANWSLPLKYKDDAPQVLGWIQAASEGDYVPFGSETVNRLGAPYQANWNDYPMYEKIIIFLLGMVARCTGLFVASNVGVLLGHLLSAVSFYACCRFLRYSRVWSFVGAALFSFTYYHFRRGLGHLFLAYSYPVPWAILSCWIIVASRRLRLGDRLSWVVLISAVVMGLGNPYNLNIYLQLLCLGMLVQFLRSRRRENLRVGLLAVAAAGAAFFAINFGTLLYQWAHGKNPYALERLYLESELYALKPIEFLIPPPVHNIGALAEIGNRYEAWAFVKGELFSPYLGIVGLAGLAWIFAEAFLRIVRGSAARLFPPYALQAVWIIFYSMIGGLNCLISLWGIRYFRSSNRCSIFISAIILLFLVSRLSVWSRRISPRLTYLVAAAVLLLGMCDQAPRPIAPEDTLAISETVRSDQPFGRRLEETLPHGSMIFQMPVMAFLDAPAIGEVTGYEMLRPYFATKTMRFSFGTVRGRTREEWQWEVEKLPVPQMVAALEQYGFSAIYINRSGYADHAASLLKQLAEAGRKPVLEDDAHEQVCVALNPFPSPVLPHTDDRAEVLYRTGWVIQKHSPLENQEWSDGNASLSFFSEAREPTTYSLRCTILSISERRVSIEMDGRELWSAAIPAGRGVPVDISVVGSHGNNKLRLKTDAGPVHITQTPLPLAFEVMNLKITKTP